MNKDIWREVIVKSHPVKNGRWVECLAHIRNNSTGEIRILKTNEVLYDGDTHPSIFNWAKNNFSCDCNREDFFARAAGIDLKEEPKCSHGRFSVNLENPVTNEIYYREY